MLIYVPSNLKKLYYRQGIKMSESDDENNTKNKTKVWKLKGGVMVVRYVGYKNRGDKEMILELEFTFDKDPTMPRIVGG